MSTRLGSKVLLQLIERNLSDGASIEIDGLGRFQLNEAGEVVFLPSGRIRVFIAYAQEDRIMAQKLYDALRQAGFEPWMDQKKLLPGQNWPRAIERAIDLSQFFVSCFSRRATSRRGYFQSELRYALDVAGRIPNDQIYLIPVRLDPCAVPKKIANKVQHVDLFPNWDQGVAALLQSMWQEAMSKSGKLQLLS
jgi:hypothetical protein